MTKQADAAEALVKVIAALEPLVESDRTWVLQSAASRWSMVVPLVQSAPMGQLGATTQQSLGGQKQDVHAAISKNDARAFIRSTKPENDIQRVACLGYFHMKTTGASSFTSTDLEQVRTNSGMSKLNLTRAVDNATRSAKFLSTVSGRQKQLTTLGEDVVEALPDQEAVKAAIKSSSSQARRAKPKKRKKKSG